MRGTIEVDDDQVAINFWVITHYAAQEEVFCIKGSAAVSN